MYTNEEIDLIAKAYSTIRIIDATVKNQLNFLYKTDNPDIPEEILKNCKKFYDELCGYLNELPKSVREYPLIVDAKKTLEERIGLLHMGK